jgi:hypothetical protein
MTSKQYKFKYVAQPYRFKAEQHIHSLNEFKEKLYKDIDLDKKELQYICRCCGLPTNAVFLSEFRKSTWLVKTSKTTWRFAPFTYRMKAEGLDRIYASYYKRVN